MSSNLEIIKKRLDSIAEASEKAAARRTSPNKPLATADADTKRLSAEREQYKRNLAAAREWDSGFNERRGLSDDAPSQPRRLENAAYERLLNAYKKESDRRQMAARNWERAQEPLLGRYNARLDRYMQNLSHNPDTGRLENRLDTQRRSAESALEAARRDLDYLLDENNYMRRAAEEQETLMSDRMFAPSDPLNPTAEEQAFASNYKRVRDRYNNALSDAEKRIADAEKTLYSDIPKAQTVLDYETRYATDKSPAAIALKIEGRYKSQFAKAVGMTAAQTEGFDAQAATDLARERENAIPWTQSGISATRGEQVANRIMMKYTGRASFEILGGNTGVVDELSPSEEAVILQMASERKFEDIEKYVDALESTLNARSFDRQISALNKSPRAVQAAVGLAGAVAGAAALVEIQTDNLLNNINRIRVKNGEAPQNLTWHYTDTKGGAAGSASVAGYARAKSLENDAPVIKVMGKEVDLSKVVEFVGQTVYSTIDNLILSGLGPQVMLAVMAMSAGGQAGIDVLNRGGTQGQAAAMSALSAAIEALTEKAPIDEFFKIKNAVGPRTFREIMNAMWRVGGSEATEEGISFFGNALADAFIMGDESEYRASIREYEKKHSHEEAVRLANRDFFIGLAKDVTAGFLSGAEMAGVPSVTTTIRNRRADLASGRDIANNRQIADLVLDEGMKVSDSRIQAEARALDAIRHENRNTEGFQWSKKDLRRIGEVYNALDADAKARIGDEEGVRVALREAEIAQRVQAREAELRAERDAANAGVVDERLAEQEAETDRLADAAGIDLNELEAVEAETPAAQTQQNTENAAQTQRRRGTAEYADRADDTAAEMDRLAAVADEATRTGDRSVLDNAINTQYNERGGAYYGTEGADTRGNQGSVAGMDEGRSGISGNGQGMPGTGNVRSGDTGLSGVISVNTRRALDSKGATNAHLSSSDNNYQAFSDALQTAIDTNKNGKAVSPKTVDELQQSGAKTFLSDDGMAGVLVTRDGDVEAVFKNPQSAYRKVSDDLIVTAIENGGTKLDCYGEGLARMYAAYGFTPVAVVDYNAEYDPGLPASLHNPDVYVMMHNGDSAQTVAEKLGTYAEPDFSNVRRFGKDDYDAALSYRDSLLEQRRTASTSTQKTSQGQSAQTTPEQAARTTDQSAMRAGLSAEDSLAMSNLARDLGVNLEFRRMKHDAINGFYNRETNTVVLNQNLSTADMAWTTFAHEITHAAETAGNYDQIREIAKRYATRDADKGMEDSTWRGVVDEQRRRYAQEDFKLSREDAEFEAVANIMQDILGSREALEGVVRESKANGRALLSDVDNVLDRTTTNNAAITPEAARLAEAQKALARALNDAQENARYTASVPGQQVEASISGINMDEIIKTAVEKYGRMKPGVQYTDENGNALTHEETMANAYEDGKRTRKGYRTAAEANVSDPILQDIHNRAVLDQYTPQTNAETVAAAKAMRKEYDTFDEAYRGWQKMLDDGLPAKNKSFAEHVAFGQQLYLEALHQEHNGQAAIEILTDIAQFETALGRGVQAANLLKQLSPEGDLIKVRRLAQQLDQRITPKNGTKKKLPADVKKVVEAVEVSEELQQKINQYRQLKKLEKNGGKLAEKVAEQIADLEKEIEDLTKKLEPLSKKLAKLKAERAEDAKEAGKLKREKTWLEGTDGKPGKLAKLALEIHNLDDEIMFLNAELLPKRKELQSKIANERLTREERNILARELRSVNHAIEKATAQIAEHQHEINTLTHNLSIRRIEKISKLADERLTRAKRNELAKELRHIDTEIKNANKLILEHQQDIADYMAQMNVREATLEELEQYEKVVLNSRQIMNAYLRYTQNKGSVEIPLDIQTAFLNAKTDEEREKIRYQMDVAIADQLPGTWAEKWRTWRYISMLFNPSTHVRNIGGNAVQFAVAGISDTVAAAVEAATMKGNAKAYSEAVDRVAKLEQSIKDVTENKEYSKEYKDIQLKRLNESRAQALQDMEKNERRHAVVLPKVDAALYKAATDDYRTIKDDLQAGGKSSETQRIEDLRKIYTSWLGQHIMEPIRKFSGMSLEKEDAWFLQGNYTRSFAEYLKANGIDPDTMTEAQRNRARAIAFQDALEATYRDASALADKLNDIEKMNPFARFFMAGLMPFKKTPINIPKRGVEYSPIGLIRGSAQLVKIANGTETNRTKSEAIGTFCKGVTGTALVAMGFLLAGAGKIRLLATPGADDKERDRKMDEATGQQNYAIQIGDKFTYTLDWLVPASIPLFVGARMREVYGAIRDKNFSGAKLADAAIDGMISMMNPLFELTMLDGVTSLLKSYRNEGSGVAAAALWSVIESYALQGLPTLVGKLARTIDPYQRSTKAQSGTAALKEVEKLYRRAVAKIPGLSQVLLYPVKDQYGENKKNVGGDLLGGLFPGGDYLGRFLYNMLSPGYFKEITHYEIDEELKKLYAKMQEINPSKATSVLPPDVPSHIAFEGENYYLNSKQYAEYAETQGKKAYSDLEKLFASDEYINANDAMQAKMVAKVFDEASEEAKMGYFEDIGLIDDYYRHELDGLVYDDTQGYRQYKTIPEATEIYEQGRIDLKTVYDANETLKGISGNAARIDAMNKMNLDSDEYNFLYMTKIASNEMEADISAVINAGGSLDRAVNIVSQFYKWDANAENKTTGEKGAWVSIGNGAKAEVLAKSNMTLPAIETMYLRVLTPADDVEKQTELINEFKSAGKNIKDYLNTKAVLYDGGVSKYKKTSDIAQAFLDSDLPDDLKELGYKTLGSDAQGVPAEIAAFKKARMTIDDYLRTKAVVSKTDAKGNGLKNYEKARELLKMDLKSYTAAITSVITSSENQATGIQNCLNMGISDRKVAEGYAKYAEINANDALNATQKATEFSKWLNTDKSMSNLTTAQRDMMRASFVYYMMTPASAGRYDNLMKLAGMSSAAAESISADIAKLEPKEGSKSVSDLQRLTAVAYNTTATDKQIDLAMQQILDSSDDGTDTAGLTKYRAIRAAGMSAKQYVDFRTNTESITSDKDSNGKDIKGRTRQDKIWAYINSLPISSKQKDALHLVYYKESTLSKTPWH